MPNGKQETRKRARTEDQPQPRRGATFSDVFIEMGDDVERWFKGLAPWAAVLTLFWYQNSRQLFIRSYNGARDFLVEIFEHFRENGGPVTRFFQRHRPKTERFRDWAHNYRVQRTAEHAQLRRRNVLAELFTIHFTRL